MKVEHSHEDGAGRLTCRAQSLKERQVSRSLKESSIKRFKDRELDADADAEVSLPKQASKESLDKPPAGQGAK